MVKVLISKQNNYPIGVTKIKKKLEKFFIDHGIVSDAEVSIGIIGEKKMLAAGKYLKDKKLHNVLSFTPNEVKNFVYPPNGVLYLGEIVVCYPLVLAEAKRDGVLIDDKVYDLIEHGALHLLGIHHEE